MNNSNENSDEIPENNEFTMYYNGSSIHSLKEIDSLKESNINNPEEYSNENFEYSNENFKEDFIENPVKKESNINDYGFETPNFKEDPVKKESNNLKRNKNA